MDKGKRIELLRMLTRCDGILVEDVAGQETVTPTSYRIIGALPERRDGTSMRIWRDGEVLDIAGKTLGEKETGIVDQKLIALLQQKLYQLKLVYRGLKSK